MFWKTALAVILTVAIAFLSKSTTFTVAVFLIAMFAVFISEGVRIVPQQNAWVVERLGKFSRILEPGLNLIVPFLDRGQPVVLDGWANENAGIARVKYRGSTWDARVAASADRPPVGSTLYIEAQEGTMLVVAAAPPR